MPRKPVNPKVEGQANGPNLRVANLARAKKHSLIYIPAQSPCAETSKKP